MRTLKQWRQHDDSDAGMTIEQLREMKKKLERLVTFSLHSYSGRWGLRYHLVHLGWFRVGWVLSEKSRRVRSFATADAAFNVARTFGQGYIKVDLDVVRTLPVPPIVS